MATTAAVIGLRERKRLQTQEALETAAFALFEARGFDDVTIEEIAAVADVSPRTVYRYYPCKEDLVFGVTSHGIEPMTAALESRPTGEPVIESLRLALLELAAGYECDLADKSRRIELVVATPSLRLRWIERQLAIEDVLVPLITQRMEDHLGSGVRPRLIAACAVAAIRVASDVWLADGGEESLIDAVDNALTMLRTGLDQT